MFSALCHKPPTKNNLTSIRPPANWLRLTFPPFAASNPQFAIANPQWRGSRPIGFVWRTVVCFEQLHFGFVSDFPGPPGPGRIGFVFSPHPRFSPKTPEIGFVCHARASAWRCHCEERSDAAILTRRIGFVFRGDPHSCPKTAEIGFVWRTLVCLDHLLFGLVSSFEPRASDFPGPADPGPFGFVFHRDPHSCAKTAEIGFVWHKWVPATQPRLRPVRSTNRNW